MAEKRSWIQTLKDVKTIVAAITAMAFGIFVSVTWVYSQAEKKVKTIAEPIAKSVVQEAISDSLSALRDQVDRLADFTDSTRYDLAELKTMIKNDLKSRGKTSIVREAERKSKEDKEEASIREQYRRN